MKKLVPLVMIAALTLMACEQDSIESVDKNQEQQLTITKDAKNTEAFEITPGDNGPLFGSRDSQEEVEKAALWAAFILGKAIKDDADSRADFLTAYNANLGAIQASDLLSDDYPDLLDYFEILVDEYLNPDSEGGQTLSAGFKAQDPCPGNENGTPPIPPIGGTGGNGFGPPDVAEFMEHILETHCIEFYFPSAINFASPKFNITTTAHPMTNAQFNGGQQRHEIIIDGCYITHTVLVNASYVATHDNIIIAKPYLTVDCDYNVQYPGVNFDGFLE